MSRWRTDFPSWHDSGLVELQLADGTVWRGDMTLNMPSNGPADTPIPAVDIGNGIQFDFGRATAWRAVSE